MAKAAKTILAFRFKSNWDKVPPYSFLLEPPKSRVKSLNSIRATLAHHQVDGQGAEAVMAQLRIGPFATIETSAPSTVTLPELGPKAPYGASLYW